MNQEQTETKRTNAAIKQEMCEDYIRQKYDFRFNVIRGLPEYRNRTTDTWHPINDYKLNSLKRELITALDLSVSAQMIKEILSSDFAPLVNPVKLYFEKLPNHGYENAIMDMSLSVKVANKANWFKYLQKWAVSTVANALEPYGCQNHTCLTLTGGQGKFKTTWLDLLTPPALSEYSFTGKIDPTNKDSQTLLAECFIINIDDQLRQLNRKDENDLKELITKPSIKYRRPYDKYIETYPRMASFVASVNGDDFLTDHTGSRRFLPFKVLDIDINSAQEVDMNLFWAEAYSYYKRHFRYWFNHEEVQQLNVENEQFQVITPEEQLILQFFRVPGPDYPENDYLQPAMILAELQNRTAIRNLNTKKLGEALGRLGFQKVRKTIDGKVMGVYPVHIIRDDFRGHTEGGGDPF